MSQHTGESWECSADGIISTVAGKKIVAFLRNHGEPQTMANGRLIAAAPHMLFACLFARDMLKDCLVAPSVRGDALRRALKVVEDTISKALDGGS